MALLTGWSVIHEKLIEGGLRSNGMHCGTINSLGLSICYRVVPAQSVATAIWAIVFSSTR